jgi:uncharacterized protein YgiM (DUF1202 family)
MKPNRVILAAVIIVIGLFTIAQAELRPAAMDQPTPPSQQRPKTESNSVKFPYVGEIISSQVNVRSGPGMNFYSCGKIDAPLRIIVVGQKYSWSQILPPPGSFSWIFKQYVQTDTNNPHLGIVNADNVRIYAGSDEMEPMRSDSVQMLLARGEKVQIISQAVGDYYKITPPEGATLWTTSQYIKYIRSADEIDIKIPRTEPDANAGGKPGIIVEQVEARSRQLEQYYGLKKQFEDEKIKPIESQDHSKIKAELAALMADANSGEAGNYAKYLLKDVERCELAKQSQIEVQEYKTELDERLGEIEEEHKEQSANSCDLAKYAVTGIFKQSAVYEKRPEIKRYLIVDSNGSPICYAESAAAEADANDANFTDYYEKQVGLIGNITKDEQSNLGLVRFEKIELLEKEATALHKESIGPEAPEGESTPAPEQPQEQTEGTEEK